MSSITTKKGRVHYLKYGQGPKTLIAFHGFADNAEMFAPFGEMLDDIYTIYAIDLPFHGQTTWQKNDYAASDINEIILEVLQLTHCLSYDILGYSLGGTIILSVLAEIDEPPDRIILLAPGGVKVRGLSNTFPMPMLGRKIAYFLTEKPSWLVAVVSFLTKVGLIHNFYVRYVKAHMRTTKNHKRLFYTWFALSHFPVNIRRVVNTCQSKSISMLILTGSRDKVVDSQALRQAFGSRAGFKVVELEQNHLMLNKKVAETLRIYLANET